MRFFVYVIESNTTGRRYVGQTSDLSRRLGEHNNPNHNLTKYTSKQAGPWELIHKEVFVDRTDAMKRELWLKSGIGRQWINDKFGRASPPKAD